MWRQGGADRWGASLIAGESVWRERDRIQFGHDRGKGETKEEENADVRDPAVSEEKRREGTRAVVLTRGRAEWGKRRKGKGEKRKASRMGKFSFLFLI